MLQAFLLGQYTLTVAGHALPPLPTEKSRSLLAYLLLQPAPRTRSHLAGLFWPELPEKNARRRLTQELWRIGSELTKAGVDGLLANSGPAVSLNPQFPLVCDARQLQEALARLRNPAPDTWPNLAALATLYQGELLPGFYDDWVLVERERIFQAYSGGLEQLLAAAKRLGDWAEAARVVDALRQLDPLAEEWVAEAMQLALRLERPEMGLRHYDQYAQQTQAELATAPGPQLVALAQHLSAHEQRANLAQSAAFTDPAYQPPLIGRDGERALLLRALDQAQAGQGQICLMEGAAGVGKDGVSMHT